MPVPAAIVTDVVVEKKGSGISAVAKVPVIAGGSGSVLDLKFSLGRRFGYEGKRRSVVTARCPDGKFDVALSKVLFKNEAGTPGNPAQTILKGRVLAPCTAKD